MKAIFEFGDSPWEADLSEGIDLSIPLHFSGSQPNAFGLEEARKEPVRVGSFVGATAEGGSVNCFSITMAPHGNGTHTECVGHIVDEQVSVCDVVPTGPIVALVITVDPVELGDTDETYGPRCEAADQVLTRERLAAVAKRHEWGSAADALIIRTGPNTKEKWTWQYSQTNPAYLTKQAMDWIGESRFEHLLVDLPSVDREEDDGWLGNHHRFWSVSLGGKRMKKTTDKTITELVFVPNRVLDGLYALQIQVPPFILDAAPSRPFLYPIRPRISA
jgi:kynurenine formamidase